MASTPVLVSSDPRQLRSSASSPLAKVVGVALADEVAAVLAQRLERLGVAVPAQTAPDDLVDVVVAALRVRDEADGVSIERAVDGRLVDGAGVDGLAVGRLRVRDVPVGHRVLRAQAVGDVRVQPDLVARVNLRAQGRQRVAHLRTKHQAGQPGRLARHQVVELVHPVHGEALRRQPHRRVRVKLAQARGLALEEPEHVPRLGVARVAAWHQDGVDARQTFEDLGPLLHRQIHSGWVAVVLVERGIPRSRRRGRRRRPCATSRPSSPSAAA